MTFDDYLKSTKEFLNQLFSLKGDKANESETIAGIRKGVEFQGINVWILIFAIFVASIGLNVNSTAVVIGAMLISPLMGPIMGVGLSLGIYDFGLFTKSLKNLSVMVVISILTSSLYFLISPLSEAQSELISRTSPTIWDVFIALFGGLAGIVAGSSREKGNAIPGVAIATALMPPLCTAGYGLANSNWNFFFGGFYLFIINTIFIALTTYFVVRTLKFKKKEFLDPIKERRVTMIIPVIALLTIIPSVFLAINLVRESVETTNITRFLKEEIDYNRNQIISSDIKRGGISEVDTLVVFLLGKHLDQSDIDDLTKKLSKYQANYYLEVKQDLIPQQKVDMGVLRSEIMKDLYKNNEEIILDKDSQIKALENRLYEYEKEKVDVKLITEQIKIFEESIDKMAVNQMIFYDYTKSRYDTIHVALIDNTSKIANKEKIKLSEWLKLTLQCDSLLVIFEKQ